MNKEYILFLRKLCKDSVNILNWYDNDALMDQLHPVNILYLLDEIERQRALISTAIEHIKEHEQCYPTPNRMTQWLKDAGVGE